MRATSINLTMKHSVISLRTFALAVLLSACTASGEQRETQAPDAHSEVVSVSSVGGSPLHRAGIEAPVVPLEMPREAWRSLVSKEVFDVMFNEETEPPGCSPLNAEKRSGTYVCAACYLPLFESDAKFESGTGWPSFWRPIDGHVATKGDNSYGMIRTEYHCARCGGHQGHLFDDGPEPTGLRYCTNGLALRFVPGDEPLPALRGDA